MNKNVYIVGDMVVTLTEEEYRETFTEQQIKDLENNNSIEWIDENGEDHVVRLISN